MKGRSLGPSLHPSRASEREMRHLTDFHRWNERLAALAGDLARTPVLLDVQLDCRPSHCPQEGRKSREIMRANDKKDRGKMRKDDMIDIRGEGAKLHFLFVGASSGAGI